MSRLLAVLGVVVVLGVPVAAQRPPAPAGAVGPRYEPQKAYYARNLCTLQDSVSTRIGQVKEEFSSDASDETLTAITNLLVAEQLMVSALIADARVQDPSFQCYFWDFTPPEPEGR